MRARRMRVTRADAPFVPIDAVYVFTAADFRVCLQRSRERTAANRRLGIVDKNRSGRPGEAIDLQGVLGEYALAKLFGVEDLTVNTECCSAAKDRFDATLWDKSIDVKTIFYTHLGLLVYSWKADVPLAQRPDLYALMHLHGWSDGLALHNLNASDAPRGFSLTASFKGMIPSKVILTEEYLKPARDGVTPDFYAPLERLRPWHDLLCDLHGGENVMEVC